MADQIDWSKYGDPYEPEDPAAVDWTKYGDRVEGSSTADERFDVAAETAKGAAVQYGAVAPAAILGAKIGAPGGIASALANAAALGGAAYFGGTKIREAMNFRQPEDFPEELRPAAYAGESFGGGVAMLSGPFAFAATGARVGGTAVGTFIDKVIASAATSPVKFAIAEVSSAATAATAAGVAEANLPGNDLARGGAEMVGGAVAPARILAALGSVGMNAVTSLKTRFSKNGAMTSAGKTLMELHEKAGEDYRLFARILREPGVLPDTKLTAAQKTGSRALSVLEQDLIKYSGKFGDESAKKAQDAMDTIRTQISLMAQTGDPEALRAAAELRTKYYRGLISARTEMITAAARDAALKIAKDTPDARRALSEKATKVADDALTAVEGHERMLWEKVKNKPVGFENLTRQFNESIAKVEPSLRGEFLGDYTKFDQFIKTISKTDPGTQVYDSTTMTYKNVGGRVAGTDHEAMKQYREFALQEARNATMGDKPNYKRAKFFGEIAEAILDDIDVAYAKSGDLAYDEARTFTREKYDVFMRSFVGRTNATGAYGRRMDPGIVLKRAFASGGEAADIQLADLEEASRFLADREIPAPDFAAQMMDTQDRFIRLAAAKMVSDDGTVNFKSLNSFIRENAGLLDRFEKAGSPLKKELMEAVSSAEKRQRFEALAKGQIDLVEKRNLAGKILKRDGLDQVKEVFVSSDQEAAVDNLLRIVKDRTGKIPNLTPETQAAAMTSIKSTIMNSAINQAFDQNTGTVNLEKLRSVLMRSNRVGGKDPLTIMRDKGLIEAKDVEHIKKLFNVFDNLKIAEKPGTRIEVKTDISDVVLSLLNRVLGSAAARPIAKVLGGESIIAGAAGAKAAESLATKMPIESQKAFLVEMLSDPERAAVIYDKMGKSADAKKQANHVARLGFWLTQSGLRSLMDEAEQGMAGNEGKPPAQQMSTRSNPRNTQ